MPPRLPTRWDLGNPTNNLERPIRIASYNVGAIGRAGQHIAQGKKAAGAGMQQLASGLSSLGGKLSAEEKRAAKAAAKKGKGGGGGSGRSGDYNRAALAGTTGDGSEAPTTDTSVKDPTTGEAVTDTGTGMPVAPTNRPAPVKSSMTTSDAYTSNAFFISGQKTQLEEDARSWTPEMVKSPDFVKEYMAGLKVLGQDHFAPIDGSPLITDTNAGKINTKLVNAYLAIAESAAKKRAAILGVAAVKKLGEASVKVHGPQYADNTVDPVPVWEDEKIAIKANRKLDQSGRDAALKASSINASRRYLSRFPYDQQLDQLDALPKNRKDEYEFMTNLTEPERKALRMEIAQERDAQEKDDQDNLSDIRGSVLTHDMPADEEVAASHARVVKNPTRKNIEALGQLRAALAARTLLYKKTPYERAHILRMEEAKLGRTKGAATHEQQVFIEAIRELNKADLAAIEENKTEFAIKVDIIKPSYVDTKDPQSIYLGLRNRKNDADVAAEVLGGDPKYTLPGEPETMVKLLQQGGETARQTYAAISRAMGHKAPDYYRELASKTNKVLPKIQARSGWLLDLDPKNAAGEDTTEFYKRFNAHRETGSQFKWALPSGTADSTKGTLEKRIKLAAATLKPFFGGQGGRSEQLREHADRVMDQRIVDGDITGYTDAAYEGILKELVGASVSGDKTYGGWVERDEANIGNWLGTDQYASIVPPEVETSRFHILMHSTDIEKIFGARVLGGITIAEDRRPVTGQGGAAKRITNAELKTSPLEMVQEGEWRIVQEEGPPMKYWMDPVNPSEPFILKWEDIKGDLRDNNEESFKPRGGSQ